MVGETSFHTRKSFLYFSKVLGASWIGTIMHHTMNDGAERGKQALPELWLDERNAIVKRTKNMVHTKQKQRDDI
jgi:hypothetical protein